MSRETYPVECVEDDENWEAWKNLAKPGEGDIERHEDWRKNSSIAELKQKWQDNGWSAFVVSSDESGFKDANFKTFDYQLTKDHCKTIDSNSRTIYIYKKSACKAIIDKNTIGELHFEDENWQAYLNIDIPKQGDVEIIKDWKNKHTIDQLKDIIIAKNYTSVTVSNGKPSFTFAAFKKFPFKLTKDLCTSVADDSNRPCVIWIWKGQPGREIGASLVSRKSIFRAEMDAVLIDEVWHENFQGAKNALDQGAYIEAVGGKEVGTALNAASWTGNVDIMKMLLENGANLHLPNSVGLAPIHQAALYNHLEAAQLLLDYGADKNVKIPQDWPFPEAGKLPVEIVGARVTHQAPKEDLLELLKVEKISAEQPYYAEGPAVVLVLRESPRSLIFEHAQTWLSNPMDSRPMTLANCPEYGVCCKAAKHHFGNEWAVKRLCIGPKEFVMDVHVKEKWIVRTVDDDWLDVCGWQYKEENVTHMLHNLVGNKPTGEGQDFVVNVDGSISPANATWLCLGVEQPRCVLVPRASRRVLHFANKPEGLFKLTLAGCFSNLGLISRHGAYHKAGEWRWKEAYIGTAEQAIRAQREETFIRREKDGFALDVKGWKYEVNNEVNWVGGDNDEKTKQKGGGRDFIPDPRAEQGLPFTLVCGGSPGFVVGASMDLRLFFQITSKGNMLEVVINMPNRKKLLHVDENATLAQLLNMADDQKTEQEDEFKVSLIQEEDSTN